MQLQRGVAADLQNTRAADNCGPGSASIPTPEQSLLDPRSGIEVHCGALQCFATHLKLAASLLSVRAIHVRDHDVLIGLELVREVAPGGRKALGMATSREVSTRGCSHARSCTALSSYAMASYGAAHLAVTAPWRIELRTKDGRSGPAWASPPGARVQTVGAGPSCQRTNSVKRLQA